MVHVVCLVNLNQHSLELLHLITLVSVQNSFMDCHAGRLRFARIVRVARIASWPEPLSEPGEPGNPSPGASQDPEPRLQLYTSVLPEYPWEDGSLGSSRSSYPAIPVLLL